MFESELRSELLKKMSLGQSKHELYEFYKGEYREEKLRATLASIPSTELRKRYRIKFMILSLIWGVFVILELLSILELLLGFNIVRVLSLVAAVYLTLNIWRFNGKFFLSGIIWFGITVIKTLILLVNSDQSESNYTFLFFFALTYSSMLVLGIYIMQDIKTNVFGYYDWFTLKSDEEENLIFQQEKEGV